MSSNLNRLPGVFIKPSESSPSGTLNLSFIDKLPELRVTISVVFVYRHGEEADHEVFKDALSKVLVPYYPLAGRLKENSHGDLQVACTGEGAWLIEAFANYGLDSVNYYDDACRNQLDDLLPTPPPESLDADPLLQFQLTRFASEGLVIGFTFCHSLVDGFGIGQFLNAVAEAARGFPHPSVAPVWQREAISAPARASNLPLVPTTASYRLQHASMDVSFNEIEKLKKEFLDLTGEYCSTFDVVVASLWQNRTRAVGFDQDTMVNLAFPANARGFLNPPLPVGYYGNCIYQGSVTVSSGFLVQASKAEVVRLVRDCKARLPSEFRNFIESDSHGGGGFPLAYTTLGITDWTGLGLNKINYGKGDPDYVMPANEGFGTFPVAILVHSPTPKKGIRMITYCVQAVHLQSLVRYYKQYY